MEIYKNQCQSCHKKNLNGIYESELFGDNYIPSLIGLSDLDKFDSLNSLEKFQKSHKYSENKINISNSELEILKDYFVKNDLYLKENNLIYTTARWQLFLDKYKNFASIPPYGKINAINVSTGEINWQIPFGYKESDIKGVGDFSINDYGERIVSVFTDKFKITMKVEMEVEDIDDLGNYEYHLEDGEEEEVGE